MSDIKKRLELLRKKKVSRNTSGVSGNRTDSANTEVNDNADADSSLRKSQIDQLKQLISGVERRSPAVRTSEPDKSFYEKGLLSSDVFEGPGQSIEDLIPGEYIETPHGSCFRVKTEYPYHHYQGSVAVSELLDKNPDTLEKVIAELTGRQTDFSKTLFFDTETTGLDTGAGVYIFLAGLGYFDGNRFVVEQYFMRDFPEEPAVLDALEETMNRFDTLVTYNGKTYDWPLLESRFAMNRRSVPMNNPMHLDLLHVARKLYKHRLENCRLVSVEEGVLDFHRLDDLPGALLPERYFQYVRSRDARFIHQAFAHNANDIVSMAALLSSVITLLSYSGGHDVPAEDLYSFARVCDSRGDHINAVNAYTNALEKGLNTVLYQGALQSLSMLHKRRNEWEKACQIWQIMVQTAPGAGVFPHVELAKYYEHQVRDYMQAKAWVEKAVQRSSDLINQSIIMSELNHRLARIERKIKGTKESI
jgi:uncharacterized protein